MPKIDYKTRDKILKEFGKQALCDFEKLSYADRYLYKQYIRIDFLSPTNWLKLKANKKNRGKYQKVFDKEASDFNADEVAKELNIPKKQVWDIYNSAITKIRKIIYRNPQKYEDLREFLRDFDK